MLKEKCKSKPSADKFSKALESNFNKRKISVIQNKDQLWEGNIKEIKDQFLLNQEHKKSIRISNDADIDMYLFPNKVITPVVKVFAPIDSSQHLNLRRKVSKEITTPKVDNFKGSRF